MKTVWMDQISKKTKLSPVFWLIHVTEILKITIVKVGIVWEFFNPFDTHFLGYQGSPETSVLSDPSESQSFWQYQQDPDVTLTRSISTRDLISWSYQIARGMDYLASKKVCT